MKQLALLAAIAFPLTAQVGVLSVHPWFEERDLADDSRFEELAREDLKSTDSQQMFKRVGIGRFEYREEGQTRKYEVSLARIGGELFVDLSEKDPGPLSLGLHMLVRIRSRSDEMDLEVIDPGELLDRHQAEMHTLQHFRSGDATILTAETARLREFVSRYARDLTIFSEDLPMLGCRLPPPPPPPVK